MHARRLSTQWLKLLTLALVVAFAAVPSSADVVRGRGITKAPALVSPSKLGYANDYRQRLDAGMKAIVDNKQLAGVATLVARHGQVVQRARGSDLRATSRCRRTRSSASTR